MAPPRTRLKTARLRKEWSIRKCADECGVGYSIIWGWENRRHCPRADHAIRVAETLGLTWGDIKSDVGIRHVPRVRATETTTRHTTMEALLEEADVNV